MKNSFNSFTTCELSDEQLEQVPGGRCPCPDNPIDGTVLTGDAVVSQDEVVYYYFF